MSESNTYYLPVNTVLLATGNDDQGEFEAKEYCRFNKFEKGDVKIARKGDQIIVKALRPVQMKVAVMGGEGSFIDHLDKQKGESNGN